MSLLFDFNKLNILRSASSTPTPAPASTTTTTASNETRPITVQAPSINDVKFFNEPPIVVQQTENQNGSLSSPLTTLTNYFTGNTTTNSSSSSSSRIHDSSIILTPVMAHASSVPLTPIIKKNRSKKKVTFPDDEKIIKDYSEPPKRGWQPGSFSTSDLLDAYVKSCERHKCKPLNKLTHQLKALQDLDCSNGEKVNVLNLKSN